MARYPLTRERFAQLVAAAKTAAARKNWRQKDLARKTQLSLGVIAKFWRGQSVHYNTLVRLADALEIPFDDDVPLRDPLRHPDTAAAEFGSYHRAQVDFLVGDYICYRRRFGREPGVHRTHFAFDWSESDGGLAFIQTMLLHRDPSPPIIAHHKGVVHISAQHRLIQLVSRQHGAVRLVTLHQPIPGTDTLHGAMLTQVQVTPKVGPVLILPGMAPVALKKLAVRLAADDIPAQCRMLVERDRDFRDASVLLELTEQRYLARTIK